MIYWLVREDRQVGVLEWLLHIAKIELLLRVQFFVGSFKEFINLQLLFFLNLRQVHHYYLIVLWSVYFFEYLIQDQFHRFDTVLDYSALNCRFQVKVNGYYKVRIQETHFLEVLPPHLITFQNAIED